MPQRSRFISTRGNTPCNKTLAEDHKTGPLPPCCKAVMTSALLEFAIGFAALMAGWYALRMPAETLKQ